MTDIWTDDILDDITSWVEQAYPEEGCGLVLEDEDGEMRVRECENLADQYHEMDPEQFPRTAEEFYVIDPMEFMNAEDRGEKVRVVFHSHADLGDYFSDEDVDAATMPRDEDEPYEEAHPGVDYMVVSVQDGEAEHATLYRFEEPEGNEPYESVLEIDVQDDGYGVAESG
jgi:adenylyltransferase/sulfurtransferase